MHRPLALLAVASALAAASPALAATVGDCDGVTDLASNIVEPWETSSRTFYKGRVRVAWLDTGGEPACCSAHLLVQFFHEGDDEPGGMVCKLVSDRPGAGFAGVDMASIKSRYDPKRGLLVTFGYAAFPLNGDGAAPARGSASVRVNLAAGTVTVE
ncbi:MAG: hypothetical protein Q8L66_08795 [Caulobacter sp.]|nr:hypothetical protein [Caulobacter sp.]